MRTESISQPAEIKLQRISKVYPSSRGEVTAVEKTDLHITPGEFVTLLGPSGCGKTTTLRMIAGFETPTTGKIYLNGKDITLMPTNKRPMSMVFQSYALFPHLSVRRNVGFGLDIMGLDKETKRERIDKIMKAMHISEYADRAPHQLSGGQQQRVALARALVMEPQVLLFDEPLSNLDAKLRAFMRVEIRRIQKEFGITSIFVTHDQDEAMMMSDTIVVMSKGRIEQIGTPAKVYREPNSKFVAEFLGTANFVSGTVSKRLSENLFEIKLEESLYQIPGVSTLSVGDTAKLVIRAESIHVGVPDNNVGKLVFNGKIDSVIFHGDSIEYELILHNSTKVVIRTSGTSDFKRLGEYTDCWVDLNHIWAVEEADN